MTRVGMAFVSLVFAGAGVAEAGPLPNFDWAGPYIGTVAGWNAANSHFHEFHRDAYADVYDFDTKGSGPFGGVTTGVNWRWGAIVGGIEADAMASDIDASGYDQYNVGAQTTLKSLATLRLRSGFLLGNAFLFGTAGFAAGSLWVHYDYDTEYAFPKNVVLTGWTAGGGAELALTRKVTLKADALYYDLRGKLTSNSEDTPSVIMSAPVNTTGWLYRFGANLHF